ncbi:MAG: glutamine--fructose-6-phosphate aminotransferase [Gammaproteobacteria bacterium RIFCSPHIGHO2_12_FULL_45_9]|nr:MAG: glutamine--fructose-6-phosphate aminotransferase [Gammaproteobacteria bacterium RIFCSPHIGHO2_12_FULL_45_9]
MCGIVGAVAERNVTPILLEGLKRLEYRGYDSAGMATLSVQTSDIQRVRCKGKVADLQQALSTQPIEGTIGLAHTRWATHGAPSEVNAHPITSGNDLVIVHNGIVENHEPLRTRLKETGYVFETETDTEVIAHLIHHEMQTTPALTDAIRKATDKLEGAFAIGVLHKQDPETLYAFRQGCPLVVGVGLGEHFFASDPLALLPVTQQFVYLEEGDLAVIQPKTFTLFDQQNQLIKRSVQTADIDFESTTKGNYRHFMQKEMFEQPTVFTTLLHNACTKQGVRAEYLGKRTAELLTQTERLQIVACGTSYHAALVGRYWIESLVQLPCHIDIASEYRYRTPVIEPNTLFIALSQSGETADTLAALRMAKQTHFLGTLGMCNVPESALARESDLVFQTAAGPEVGVAATKTFTAQLTGLLLLAALCLQLRGRQQEADTLRQAVTELPQLANAVLELDGMIRAWAPLLVRRPHALFLGRGIHYPIALEGALKLKEISYLHAEAYPAGELKHGPLALVDENMPVIVIAPQDALADKLASNLQEVKARQGELFVLHDRDFSGSTIAQHHIEMPAMPAVLTPILYTIPLQLLAYHVAVLKGTDVDQPRNLAKSVTVE